MAKTVEKGWNYFSGSGDIISGIIELPTTCPSENVVNLGEKAYRMGPRTEFDRSVWGAWWAKDQISITHGDKPIEIIRNRVGIPITVFEAIKIEPQT